MSPVPPSRWRHSSSAKASLASALPRSSSTTVKHFAGDIPALTNALAYIKEASIGLAIVLFLIFEPDGLVHRWRLIKSYWKLYPFSY